ncbi:hypothetical protein B0H14DRAFT_2177127, partial [Mycena olivaceomarginata]
HLTSLRFGMAPVSKHVTLKKLGLRVQLGHAYSQSCQRPIPAHKHFMVVHSNGMHKVAIDFC